MELLAAVREGLFGDVHKGHWLEHVRAQGESREVGVHGNLADADELCMSVHLL